MKDSRNLYLARFDGQWDFERVRGKDLMAKQEIYDAIVVGSGATGGWAAKELTQKGLTVAVLEAGRKLDPLKDYTEHTWPYELKFRGFGDRHDLQRTQPIQSK